MSVEILGRVGPAYGADGTDQVPRLTRDTSLVV